MRRVLTAFGPDDYLVSDQEFPPEKVDELKPLFELYDDDPDMQYVYQIPDELRDRVSQILGIPFDPDLNYNLEVMQ